MAVVSYHSLGDTPSVHEGSVLLRPRYRRFHTDCFGSCPSIQVMSCVADDWICWPWGRRPQCTPNLDAFLFAALTFSKPLHNEIISAEYAGPQVSSLIFLLTPSSLSSHTTRPSETVPQHKSIRPSPDTPISTHPYRLIQQDFPPSDPSTGLSSSEGASSRSTTERRPVRRPTLITKPLPLRQLQLAIPSAHSDRLRHLYYASRNGHGAFVAVGLHRHRQRPKQVPSEFPVTRALLSPTLSLLALLPLRRRPSAQVRKIAKLRDRTAGIGPEWQLGGRSRRGGDMMVCYPLLLQR